MHGEASLNAQLACYCTKNMAMIPLTVNARQAGGTDQIRTFLLSCMLGVYLRWPHVCMLGVYLRWPHVSQCHAAKSMHEQSMGFG